MRALEVLTLGETMVSLRATGLIRLGCDFTSSIAGAESNVAIGLARLGHRVAWVGAVGQDEPGELVSRTLRAEGVEAHIRLDPELPTGMMLLEHRLKHTSRVVYHRSGSAGSHFEWDDVAPHVLGRPRLLHVSGITPALSLSAREVMLRAVDTALDMGVIVSLDINHREKLWSAADAAEVLGPLAQKVNHLIASEDELRILGGASEEATIAAALSGVAESVVVKRGSAGVTIVTADDRCNVRARPVEVVDTIGAGDAFTAGYLSGVLEGCSPRESGSRGVDVAAFAVSSRGDWEGLPTRDELTLLALASGETVR